MKYTIFALALASLATADCPNELLELAQNDGDILDVRDINGLPTSVAVNSTICPSITDACIAEEDFKVLEENMNSSLNEIRSGIDEAKKASEEFSSQLDEILGPLDGFGIPEEQVNDLREYFTSLADAIGIIATKGGNCFTALFEYYVGTVCLAVRADWNIFTNIGDDDDVTITYSTSTCDDLQEGCTDLLEDLGDTFKSLQEQLPALLASLGLSEEDIGEFLPDELTDPCDGQDCNDYVCNGFVGGDDLGLDDLNDDVDIDLGDLLKRRRDTEVSKEEVGQALLQLTRNAVKIMLGSQQPTDNLRRSIRERRDLENAYAPNGYYATGEGASSSIDTSAAGDGSGAGDGTDSGNDNDADPPATETDSGSTNPAPTGDDTATESPGAASGIVPSMTALTVGLLAIVLA
eukprot:Clim_evm63s218 gene=Clim_evmTU63s218